MARNATINPEAWAILNGDEQVAMGLQYGMQKSSWESGEIMDKSHYKYLEIKYRAEKFLKMFTEHLELYEEVVPTKILSGDRIASTFLKLCVEKRLKPTAAIKIINNNDEDRVYTKSGMNDRVVVVMRKWEKSEDVHEHMVYNLVKEFDRWNNFRILPPEIQEPSAYKRRIKSMYKKHIRVLSSIPKLSLIKLKELTAWKKGHPKGLMPMLNNGRYEIWHVKTNPKTLELLAELCLYIFKDDDVADEYIQSVFHYVNLGEKHCRDGIKFWQSYRELIQKAINYHQINNIKATRRHLEMALSKLEYF